MTKSTRRKNMTQGDASPVIPVSSLGTPLYLPGTANEPGRLKNAKSAEEIFELTLSNGMKLGDATRKDLTKEIERLEEHTKRLQRDTEMLQMLRNANKGVKRNEHGGDNRATD